MTVHDNPEANPHDPLQADATPSPTEKASASPLPSIFDVNDELVGVTPGTLRARIKLLTAKERACLVEVLNGANFAEAARRTGVHYGTALKLRDKIPDLMERRGLTDEILMAKLERLMDAKETKFFHAKVDGQTLYRDAETGEERLIDTTEIIIEDREVEALDVQLRALDLATKFKGWHRTIEVAESVDSHDINVNIVNVGGG